MGLALWHIQVQKENQFPMWVTSEEGSYHRSYSLWKKEPRWLSMHLMIPTHVYHFWIRYHPSRTFPPKELEWKPQRLSILPITIPHSLISLTRGPPPLYWLGTGRWCLSLVCMLHFHTSPLLFWLSRICHCLQVCLILLHTLVFI